MLIHIILSIIIIIGTFTNLLFYKRHSKRMNCMSTRKTRLCLSTILIIFLLATCVPEQAEITLTPSVLKKDKRNSQYSPAAILC